MLFLVSGASGTGKSTVREHLARKLGPAFEAVELRHLGSLENVTLARRQELAEVAAQRAAELRPHGRHLLLSGDPVAPAEIVAAPSATMVGGIAACILDADASTQSERLRKRGDPEDQLHLHVGFADWMREHATAPMTRLAVLTTNGSPIMRWERLSTLETADPRWKVRLIDTSDRSAEKVADAVASWIQSVLQDDRMCMYPEDWS